MAYRFIKKYELLDIPEIISVGSDYLEVEFVESTGECSISEIVTSISRLHLHSADSRPDNHFPQIDLSVSKFRHRLEYTGVEMDKRGVADNGLLQAIEGFVTSDYQPSVLRTLVHGDLKQPHAIHTSRGIRFIDLGLVSVASPWYDLAFLVLEQKEKLRALEAVVKSAVEVFGDALNLTRQEIRALLRSAAMYRAFYNLGFALRHRPERSVARTIAELREILKT